MEQWRLQTQMLRFVCFLGRRGRKWQLCSRSARDADIAPHAGEQYSYRQESWAGSCSNSFAPFRPCSPRAGLWPWMAGSASLPFLAWEGGGWQLPLWHGWQQKAGSHLRSLPAAKCRFYPFPSCSGLSPAAMDHSGSTGPWWLSPSLFPGATSSNIHLSTVTSAHPSPRGVQWICPVSFPFEGQSPCTVFPQEEAGAPCIPFLPSFSSEGHVPVWHLIFSTAILEMKGKLHV